MAQECFINVFSHRTARLSSRLHFIGPPCVQDEKMQIYKPYYFHNYQVNFVSRYKVFI